MKYLAAVMSVLLLAGMAMAQDKAPKAAGLKITKITGTVNLMKDGMVVMTLKPGDALPSLVDPSMTFAVVEGSIEVEAAGQKITAATGANFTVTSDNGQMNVALTAGTPVEIKNTAGNTVVLTENSEVKMIMTNGNVEVTVVTGNAMVSSSSGGASTNVQAGEKIDMVVPVVAPPAGTPPDGIEPPTPPFEMPVIPVMPVEPPSVIPSQELSTSAG